MRGKEELLYEDRYAERITPAHAGKSCRFIKWYALWQDHPRPCGEKKRTMGYTQAKQGSPPPMRGKDPLTSSYLLLARITPAHAGKSLRSNVTLCPTGITPAHAGKSHIADKYVYEHWDHPRPCGEKL